MADTDTNNTTDILEILKRNIAIAATPGFPDTIHITPQDIQNLTECGINVAIQTTSVAAFQNIFSSINNSENKELGIIQDNPYLHRGYPKDPNEDEEPDKDYSLPWVMERKA